jgi:hypothetical protein
MKDIKISFKHENGEIYLVMSQQIWGETIVEQRKITEDVLPTFDDYLDEKLGLTGYGK